MNRRFATATVRQRASDLAARSAPLRLSLPVKRCALGLRPFMGAVAVPVLLLAMALSPVNGAASPSRFSFAASDRARLSFLKAGDRQAPAIVFVPGWMCPASIWEKQIDYFGRSNFVVALDPRGQGQSDKNLDDLTPRRRAADIRELIQHLQLTNVVLVGWSMGVGEVLGCVDQFGTEGVRGLVLVDGFVGGDLTVESVAGRQAWLSGLQTNRRAFMRGFMDMFFKQPQPERWRRRLEADIARTPTAVAMTVMTGASLMDYRPALRKVDRPLLYVCQPMLKPEADKVLALAPGATVEIMDDAGHALFVDKPDDFNRWVERFVDKARRNRVNRANRAPIFDPKADAKAQVASALAEAKASSRRVLLVFGANWCVWCHRLNRLLHDDPALAARLKTSYAFVAVDVDDGNNPDSSQAYGFLREQGIPFLIVLDADGRVQVRQEAGALEDAAGRALDPAKVLGFLERWAAKP